MLTPDYLAHCTDYLLGLYDELDRAIIADIARRIIKTGSLTATAEHQTIMVQQSGMLITEVTKLVSQITGLSQKEVQTMFNNAAVTGMENDAKPLLLNGKDVEINLSEAMNYRMKAAISKTNGDLRNLTLTTGVTAVSKYEEAVNSAYMKVQSGAFSYTQAIKDAIKQAATDGNYVQYSSGHRDFLDVAVRRSVLTGINQTAGVLTEMFGEELGCEYYETSAHDGARPSHAIWQGRVFKINGSDAEHQNFYDATGYGTGAGLCGWNCRHSFHPYFPNISAPAYTKEMLDSYDEANIDCNGDKLTKYEASQLMRRSEREIRQTKRELSGLNAAKEATKDKKLKEELSNEFDITSMKLKQQEAKYKNICKQTKMKADSARTGVVAIKDARGNIISWNRSTSQKARQGAERAQKEVEKQERIAIIKEEIRNAGELPKAAKIHLAPKNIDANLLSFDEVHVNSERGHQVSESQAKKYIEDASISVTVWNGRYERYYSKDGASYVDVKDNVIRTAYSKNEFDDRVKRLVEEMKKHGILR